MFNPRFANFFLPSRLNFSPSPFCSNLQIARSAKVAAKIVIGYNVSDDIRKCFLEKQIISDGKQVVPPLFVLKISSGNHAGKNGVSVLESTNKQLIRPSIFGCPSVLHLLESPDLLNGWAPAKFAFSASFTTLLVIFCLWTRRRI